MSVVAGLRQVWRQPRFRRLFLVKLFSQTADGLIQVGVASYTILSPERAASAWAIAGVLAVTLLPFCVLGPFVSVAIDRWDRRRTILFSDTARCGLALVLAGLVWLSGRGPDYTGPIMVAALVVMSLERFQVATLLAGLPHTIDDDEYLAANTALPLIGPLGVMIGAVLGAAIRLTIGSLVSAADADVVIFALAAAAFFASVATCRRFAARSLGPDTPLRPKLSQTARDLGAAINHLRHRGPALLATLTVFAQRLVFGFVMVATILIYRNYFHTQAEVDEAVADLAVWIVATGAGFVLASAVNPLLARRLSLRVTIVAVLVAAAVNQAAPGAIFTRPTLVAASFLLGLWAQCVKMNADTLIQAHIDDTFKGRVLVLFDLAYNLPFVLAGVAAALILPDNGVSRRAFLACAGLYAALAVTFAALSRAMGAARFSRGTESMTA